MAKPKTDLAYPAKMPKRNKSCALASTGRKFLNA